MALFAVPSSLLRLPSLNILYVRRGSLLSILSLICKLSGPGKLSPDNFVNLES